MLPERAARWAVLVGRGHREVRSGAAAVGEGCFTEHRDDVQVRLGEVDDEDGVWIEREETDAG